MVWEFLSLEDTSSEQMFSDAASDNYCLIGQSWEVGVVNAKKGEMRAFPPRLCIDGSCWGTAGLHIVKNIVRNAERGSLRRGERLGWRYHDDKLSNFSPPRENPQVSLFYVTAALLCHARGVFTAVTKGKDQLLWSYQWAPCVLPRRPPHIKNGITRSCVSPIGCDTQPWHPLYLGASWGSAHPRRAEGTDGATKLPSSQSNQAFMGCHGSNTVPPQSPLEHWTG